MNCECRQKLFGITLLLLALLVASVGGVGSHVADEITSKNISYLNGLKTNVIEALMVNQNEKLLIQEIEKKFFNTEKGFVVSPKRRFWMDIRSPCYTFSILLLTFSGYQFVKANRLSH